MKIALVSFLAGLMVVGGAQAARAASASQPGTIASIALATPQLSTLVKAVQAAGLVDLLSKPGAFTVFAPTNDAFSKIPSGDLAKLLSDREALRQVILYHILPVELPEQTLRSTLSDGYGAHYRTLNGFLVEAQCSDKGCYIGLNQKLVFPVSIVSKAIEAANGVVFLIDSVILKK